MNNIQSKSTSSCFTDLPNEVLLIIWSYLHNVETINIFAFMKCQRYERLLGEYCYQTIDLYKSSLSNFRLIRFDLFEKIRLNVRVLKLGHEYSYSQLYLFAQMFPNDVPFEEMFPRLQTLVLYSVAKERCKDLLPYLKMIPRLQNFEIRLCALLEASRIVCSHLLAYNKKKQLQSCVLRNKYCLSGFILHQPIPSSYHVQETLTDLQIDINDLLSLKNLLSYLPNLSTLVVCVMRRITLNDISIFSSAVCPCLYLEKLVFHTFRCVDSFQSVVNFILLFRNSLQTLQLVLFKHYPELTVDSSYIDGDYLFSTIIIHMIKLKQFDFFIDTYWSHKVQTDIIIKSFQTEYWLSMLIGCFYSEAKNSYIILSLPCRFAEGASCDPGIVDIKFNQSGYQFDSMTSLMIERSTNLHLNISQNEKLTSSFINLFKNRNHRQHTITLKPNGFYTTEQNENCTIPCDRLVIHLCNFVEQSQLIHYRRREELVQTTMTWLGWISHLKSINADAQMLLKLVEEINRTGTINRFSSLQRLFVRQLDIDPDEDTLRVIIRLGVSLTLRHIIIRHYRPLNNQSIDNNGFFPNIYRICRNMNRLETLTIHFEDPYPVLNERLLEKLVGNEKKNCEYECINVSEEFIQLWLQR